MRPSNEHYLAVLETMQSLKASPSCDNFVGFIFYLIFNLNCLLKITKLYRGKCTSVKLGNALNMAACPINRYAGRPIWSGIGSVRWKLCGQTTITDSGLARFQLSICPVGMYGAHLNGPTYGSSRQHSLEAIHLITRARQRLPTIVNKL